MTIFFDQNEPPYIQLLLEQHVPVERLLLNKPAVPCRPDYGFLTHDGHYLGVSRKQAGEFIGGIDACESQLMDEMGGCDFMALLIEGRFTSAPDGTCYTWSYGEPKWFRDRCHQHPNAVGSVSVHRRHYRQSYMGVAQKLARYDTLGIPVLLTDSMEDTALRLVALYREMQKPESESHTFKRLLPEKYRLNEADAAKRTFAETLMGIRGAGVGEEIALALADKFSNLHSLMTALSIPWGEEGSDVARITLRGNLKEGRKVQRTIGPAVVKRLKESLGL